MIYSDRVDRFISSGLPLEIVYSTGQCGPGRVIRVLDSSFNPPTRAHVALATAGDASVLLVLSLVNADKKPVPAAFGDRLAMMQLAADEIAAQSGGAVHLCLAMHPLVFDKACDLQKLWPSIQQQWVVGSDTLVRVIDRKYYASVDDLESRLSRFTHAGHSFVLVPRPDLKTIDDEVRKRLDGLDVKYETCNVPDAMGISSTKARAAAASNDIVTFMELVPENIATYALQKKLYDSPPPPQLQ